MKLNSPRALEIGRQLFERHGGDWASVRAAGRERSDGVIDLTGDTKPAKQSEARNGRILAQDRPAKRR